MANVILIVHLLIAVVLVAVVLLQRSEGGALGIGGGGGGGGLMSGRAAATALTKLTWGLGAAFVATSMMLTVLAVRANRDTTVIETQDVDGGGVEILVPDLGDAPATPPVDEPEADDPEPGADESEPKTDG